MRMRRGGLLWVAGLVLALAGCDDPPLVEASAKVSASPDRLVLPETWVGTPVEGIVALSNAGSAGADVGDVTVEGEVFALTSLPPARLEPGRRATLTVRFLPPRPGLFRGRLHADVQGGSRDVALEGVGKAVPDCDDGNPCTKEAFDAEAGVCRVEPRRGPCDDGNACTSDDRCVRSTCLGDPVSCDDGLACTDDGCEPLEGCVHRLVVACDDGDPCTADGCGADGACTHVPGGEGLPCGPAEACATPVCRDGLCVPQPVLDGLICGDGGHCLVEVCRAGACVFEGAPAGYPCDDGNVCTSFDSCHEGSCEGRPRDCNDRNACTTDWCEGARGCVHEPVADGLACNGDAACLTPMDCRDAPVCVDGWCRRPAIADGTSCDDADACTSDDACRQGACGGTAVTCDDGNPCTKDDCDTVWGCVHTARPDGTRCGNGAGCSQVSICVSGACVLTDAAPEGTSCDDGDLCTAGDTCRAGVCEGTPSDATGLLDWSPTWRGADGVAFLGDGRLLVGDPGRLTVVDVSAGTGAPVVTKPDASTFGEVVPLAGDRVFMVSRGNPTHLRLLELAADRPLENGRLDFEDESFEAMEGLGPDRILLTSEFAKGAGSQGDDYVRIRVVEATPEGLRVRATLEVEGTLHVAPVRLSPHRFALVSIVSGTGVLTAFEIDSGALYELGRLEVPTPSRRAMVASPSALYLPRHFRWEDGYRYVVHMVDLSTPSSPRAVEVIALDYQHRAPVEVLHPETARLFILTETGVVTAWDLSDPRHPRVAADTPPMDELGLGVSVSLSANDDYVFGRWVWANGPCAHHGGVALDPRTLGVVGRAPTGPVVAWLDADHYVQDYHCGADGSHGSSRSSRTVDVRDVHGEQIALLERSSYDSTVRGRPDSAFDYSVGDGLVVVHDRAGPVPRILRWRGCERRLEPVPLQAAGPAGRLARRGTAITSESAYLGRSVDASGWPSVDLPGTVDYRANVSFVTAEALAPGPLLMAAPLQRVSWYSEWYPPDACHSSVSSTVAVLDSGETFGQDWTCRMEDAAASGPHLVGIVRTELESYSPRTIELHAWEGTAFGLLGTLSGLPCEPDTVVWTAPSGESVAVASPEGCLVLIDTTLPESPSVAWAEPSAPDGRATVALQLLGNLMVRVRGEADAAVLSLDEVDRTTLPWRVTRLSEVPTPSADRLLAFDGRTAVAGGPTPGSETDSPHGVAWVVDLDVDRPTATPVEVPYPPRWGLPVADGLLFSSEEGVGALGVACEP